MPVAYTSMAIIRSADPTKKTAASGAQTGPLLTACWRNGILRIRSIMSTTYLHALWRTAFGG